VNIIFTDKAVRLMMILGDRQALELSL